MEKIRKGFLKFLGFGVPPPVVMGSEEHIAGIQNEVKAKTITRMKVPVRIDYAATGEPEDCNLYGLTDSPTLVASMHHVKVGPTEWKRRGKDATRT